MKNFLIILSSFSVLYGCSAQNNESQKDTLYYLALGDSYTVGESVTSSQNFPSQLAEQLKQNGRIELEIIAKTGWRTDQLIKQAENTKRSNYDLITLLIGVNDEYQGRTTKEYEIQFKLMLEKAITLAGNNKSKVWVFSIPDYGYSPFGSSNQKAISAGIDEFNKINKTISEKVGVNYLDITDISRQSIKTPELIAGDGLHPSANMYALWVDKFMVKYMK